MVAALDSKSSLARGESSSLSPGTESKAKLCVEDLKDGAVYSRSSDCRESGSGKFLSVDEKIIPDQVFLKDSSI
jgi:hypothetical protein